MNKIFVGIIFVSQSVLSEAAGTKAPCQIDIQASEIAALAQRYVPSGSNGRAPAVAVYRFATDGARAQVLYEKNAAAPQAIASTQKILTAWTAHRIGGLSRETAFTEGDLFYDEQGTRAVHPGTNRVVLVGERLDLREYLNTMLVQSANGAAQALARGSAGSLRGFMTRMNTEASNLLGSNSQSYFQNPSGLTDSDEDYRFAASSRRQQSTAGELARIAGRLMTDAGFRRTLSGAGVPSSGSGYLYKVGVTNAAGKTVAVTFPLKSSCSGQVIGYALLGSPASDQLSRFRGFYDELRKLVNARH